MTGQQPPVGASNENNRPGLIARFAAWPLALPLELCCAAGLLSISLGPDNNWDLRFYHLYAPWAYLHGRYLYDIGPAQYQGFFNPTADLLFYALIASPLNEFPRVIAFIMGAVHGINVALILAIALHVFRPLQSWERWTLGTVAMAIGAAGAGFVSLLGTTTNDLIDSIFVLAALLAILKAAAPANGRAVWRGFAWAGLLAGLGVGLKYTAVIFVPGLLVMTTMAARRHRSLASFFAFGIAGVVGVLVAAGHHMFVLWRDFRNPVFPLFNQFFQSPYYEPATLSHTPFMLRNLWQLAANPFLWAQTNENLVTELPFRDWRGAMAYLAIAALWLKFAVERMAGQRTSRAAAPTHDLGFVLIFAVVSYVCWAVGFNIYRYAVTIDMLTGIIIVGAVIWLFAAPRLRAGAAVAMLAIALTTTIPIEWGRGPHPTAGEGPVPFGDRYIDVRVPPLPERSVVLLATWAPVSYFIPYAEPTAQYLGIENNYLELSQANTFATEIKRLMRTPGRPKFILAVGDNDAGRLNEILQRLGLRLSPSPCLPIHSNLEEAPLSLCPVADG
ncbi:MAG TPA: glycosyltransferase family 39 protein [Xanthobacteraceae bacterium]|nr:glycosyltransferase family 39 protein [Xanthobacteraceae bacterium]